MENILTATLSGLTADDADTAEFSRRSPFFICIPASYDGTSTVWDGATVALKIQLSDGTYIPFVDTDGNTASLAEANEGKCLLISINTNEDFVFRVASATANTVIPAILVSSAP